MTTRTVLTFATAAALSLAPLTAHADTQLGPGVLHFDGLGSVTSGALLLVAPAGDINGDGFADMVVGAPNSSPHARAQAGSAFLVLGSPYPGSASLTSAIRIDGATAFAQVGKTVAGAGDVNHDGYADLAIGSDAQDYMGRPGAGRVVVVKGGPTLTSMDLATASGGRWWTIGGSQAGDRLGTAIASGDVTNDGIDDLVLGSPNTGVNGRVTVVPGGPGFSSLDLAAPSAAIRFTGPAGVGMQISVGDATGDRVKDILIGSVLGGSPPQSQGYVVQGGAGLASAGLSATTPGVYLVRGAFGTNIGPMVTTDLTGDGVNDLVTATWATGDNSVRVLPAHPVTDDVDLVDPALGIVRYVGQGSDLFGWSMATPGDLDHDGFAELVVGSPLVSSAIGAAYVVRGAAHLQAAVMPDISAVGYTIAAAVGDTDMPAFTGYSVAALGDFNGDGNPDIAVTAPGADTAAVDSGAVWVLLGNPPPTPPAATLTVSARSASRAIPHTGRVALVKAITVGAGQTATVKVIVKPKKLKRKVHVTTSATTIKIRTKHAPKGKVRVRITASGAGVTPVTWSRTWRVRSW